MTKFIQLGERKNGRIVKNEQWSLKEFEKMLCVDAGPTIKTTVFDRVFKTKKYIRAMEQSAYRLGIESVILSMNIAIDLDIKGKGSAKKTTKRSKK